VVVEVALYDRSRPFPDKHHWLMHALAKLLFDFFQLGPLRFLTVLRFSAKLPFLSCPFSASSTSVEKTVSQSWIN
jgi:hypothetical protein